MTLTVRHTSLVAPLLAPLLAALTSGCFPVVPTAPMMASPGQIQAQQKAAIAQSMGYPTRKSPAELAAAIAQQTQGFRRLDAGSASGELERAAPYQIAADRNTCYTVVLRLADGAAWGEGAEAGLRFDFHGPSGQGTGGPGVIGPGAVASVGCTTATGPVTLTMAPMVGNDPLGHGRYSIELWSHRQSDREAANQAADQRRQADEQHAFAERERAKEAEHTQAGCAACRARFQGCLGAGRSRSSCESDYRSCAFEKAGPRWGASCPFAE
jgi:hypothetical protein